MPDPVWPATLPQYPRRSDFRDKMPETVIESQPDSGPSIARRRFTAGVRPISVSVALKDMAQRTQLETFVTGTIEGRALPFTWAGLSAVTGGGTGRFRMAATPEFTPRGAQGWIASFSVIRLPQ